MLDAMGGESQTEGEELNQSAIPGSHHDCEEEDDGSEPEFQAGADRELGADEEAEDGGHFEESDGYASDDLDDQTYYAKYGTMS